jgi:hypothetical protein
VRDYYVAIMNIVFEYDDFHSDNIFFLERKRNVVIDGFFSKIIYSDEFFTMNGIFFAIPLQLQKSGAKDAKYIHFYPHDIKNIYNITKLSEIEHSIINYYKKTQGVIEKRNNLVLTNQLYNGCFKIYKENSLPSGQPKKYMLKISGLWESANEVGITYKFMEMAEVI